MSDNNPTSPREELARIEKALERLYISAVGASSGPTVTVATHDLDIVTATMMRIKDALSEPVKAASPEGAEPVAWAVFATGERCKGGRKIDSTREEVEQYGREIYGDFEVHPLGVIAATPPVSERAEVVAKGWKLVPIEPTPEMLAAADTAIPRFEEEEGGSRVMGVDGALDAYRAMLAVAPTHESQSQGDAS